MEIPKNYLASDYEQDIYQKWEKSGFFNPDNLKGSKKTFTIVLPPPNATGVLHLGHASMLAYQDTLIRYHRLLGEKTLWLPGTDHAAIATQNVVEKKIAQEEKLTKEQLGREVFINKVKEYVAGSQNTIRQQVKAMGTSLDWSRERYTLDDGLSRVVTTAFKKMYDDGLIYRGYRIVNWCPRCHSTLADDEVEHKLQKGNLYYLQYGPVVIATTRPETKIGDTGLAVNPNDSRYQHLIGKTLQFTLGDVQLSVKCFADEAVDPQFGTGAIGVTPAHSTIDYDWAQKNDLAIIKIIDEKGLMTEKAGPYQGLTVAEARIKFLAQIETAGQLVKTEPYENNLSICYRCGTAIEPLPSKQWFVAVNKKIPKLKKSLKELSLEVVGKGLHGESQKKIQIMPESFAKTYLHWMNNLHDWCISRQIWWGHRIPVWYAGEQIYVGDNPPAGFEWQQDQDTLDTWFSSALWTFSTLMNSDYHGDWQEWLKHSPDLQKYHPTDVMETGYDILFFWVARMILMTTYLLDDIPFKQVYLHGLIRDKQGRKMSKSLGNGIDPLMMIEKYGADALRLAMMVGATPGNDIRLYDEKVEGYRNFINKLWNISRYILGSVKKSRTIHQQPKAQTDSDQWLFNELNKLINNVGLDLDNYRFSAAIEKLYDFTWSKFADWYLEISKIEKDKDEILLFTLQSLLKLWHPFAPYVTEVIWQKMDSELLMIQKWPIANKEIKVNKTFEQLLELITKIRSIKAENKIDPIKNIDLWLKKELPANNLQIISQLAKINIVSEANDNWLTIPFSGNLIKIAIDREEAEKIHRANINQLHQYIQIQKNKLSNEQFVNNAPPEIVEEERNKMAAAEEKLQQLS